MFFGKLLLILAGNISTQLCLVMQPHFQYKRNFTKLTTFSAARIIDNNTKLTADSESTIKINIKSLGRLFVILLMSVVSYKQRLSHRDKTLQYR